MKKQTLSLLALLLIATNFFAKTNTSPDKGSKQQNTNISFTENKGQIHDQFNNARPDVLFGGTDGALVFHLRNNGISYQLKRVDSWKTTEINKNAQNPMLPQTRQTPEQTTIYRLDLNWLGANPAARISHGDAFAGYANFYLENCPAGVKEVKTFEEVTYQNIYPGIDLKWYQKGGHLKYDYIVGPGADYKKIRLELKGAQEIRLDANGQLVIKTPLGEIGEQAPVVMQGGKLLPSNWKIEKRENEPSSILSFEIKNIDPNQAFTIDPLVRAWGTYYGGNGDDYGGGAVHPAGGTSFIGGYTDSSTGTVIATSGSCQDTYFGGYYDAFLVKFDISGLRLWGTYFGGGGDDYGSNCAVDQFGYSFLCGSTNSGPNIMGTSNSHQPAYGGNGDAFLARFDQNGGLAWSTYYGGVGTDDANYCAVDYSGNVFMCGDAGSTSNIASGAAHQGSKGSWYTAPYLVKFNPSGVRQWGTYYGGGTPGYVSNCAADALGNVYLTGTAGSTTGTVIATPGTHQPAYAGGTGVDAYVVKFNPTGVRQWGTYYGGPNDDYPAPCFVDSVGNVFLPGNTKSTTGISTPGVHQSVYGGGSNDGFLAKLNSSGQRVWATYYGGPGTEGVSGCLDKYGNILLAGSTDSGSGTVIATPGSYKPTYSGGTSDAFIVKLTSTCKRLWGTYYGGVANEYWSIAGLDNTGHLFLAGSVVSVAGIATPGTHQPSSGGGQSDAFLVKFNYCSPPIPVDDTPPVNLMVCEGETATLTASAAGSLFWFAAESGGTSIGSGYTFVTSTLSTGTYTYYVEAQTCAAGELRTAISVTVNACTGLAQQMLAENQTRIFPNPFSQKIAITSSLDEILPLKIYTASGELVFESFIKKEAEIDLENLSSGIYFMQIGSAVKKIVKE